MKTYLHPRPLRRGQPTLLFVKSERSLQGGMRYLLGVYHELRKWKGPKPYEGEGHEYNSVHEQTISKLAYQALLKQAHKEETDYRRDERYRSKNYVTCPVCKNQKHKNKPCIICEGLRAIVLAAAPQLAMKHLKPSVRKIALRAFFVSHQVPLPSVRAWIRKGMPI